MLLLLDALCRLPMRAPSRPPLARRSVPTIPPVVTLPGAGLLARDPRVTLWLEGHTALVAEARRLAVVKLPAAGSCRLMLLARRSCSVPRGAFSRSSAVGVRCAVVLRAAPSVMLLNVRPSTCAHAVQAGQAVR